MALAVQTKRKAAGGHERLGDLARLFVNPNAHMLSGKVDLSWHAASVASLEAQQRVRYSGS